MYKRDGVGLAANQVGSEWRLFVIDPDWANSENDNKNPIVMINPVIESRSGEIVYEEGCISLPEYFWKRKTQCKYLIHIRIDMVSGLQKTLNKQGGCYSARI